MIAPPAVEPATGSMSMLPVDPAPGPTVTVVSPPEMVRSVNSALPSALMAQPDTPATKFGDWMAGRRSVLLPTTGSPGCIGRVRRDPPRFGQHVPHGRIGRVDLGDGHRPPILHGAHEVPQTLPDHHQRSSGDDTIQDD